MVESEYSGEESKVRRQIREKIKEGESKFRFRRCGLSFWIQSDLKLKDLFEDFFVV